MLSGVSPRQQILREEHTLHDGLGHGDETRFVLAASISAGLRYVLWNSRSSDFVYGVTSAARYSLHAGVNFWKETRWDTPRLDVW